MKNQNKTTAGHPHQPPSELSAKYARCSAYQKRNRQDLARGGATGLIADYGWETCEQQKTGIDAFTPKFDIPIVFPQADQRALSSSVRFFTYGF